MNSILFQPAQIKGIQLKNRLIRSGTAESMAAPDGSPTQELKDLYVSLAQGQVGMIITSGVMIETWPNDPSTLGLKPGLSIHDDRLIDPWKEIIQAVHDLGCKIAMQTGHLGRLELPALRGSAPLAPSAVPIPNRPDVPQAMTKADIREVIEKLAQAVRRIKEAGFDAAQYHGAHGNLIQNFMSPLTNIRTDEYGGSIENRARFVVEMVERARYLVGPDFPLMIKINFNDFVEGGIVPEDAIRIAEIIAEAGMDAIEVSGGTLSESMDRIAVKDIRKEEDESYFRALARDLKKKVSVPVILVGGHRTPRNMAQILENGEADFLSLSRPLIREPGLVKRWKDGDLEKAKCISCNQCFFNWMFFPLRCFMDHPLQKEEQAQIPAWFNPGS